MLLPIGAHQWKKSFTLFTTNAHVHEFSVLGIIIFVDSQKFIQKNKKTWEKQIKWNLNALSFQSKKNANNEFQPPPSKQSNEQNIHQNSKMHLTATSLDRPYCRCIYVFLYACVGVIERVCVVHHHCSIPSINSINVIQFWHFSTLNEQQKKKKNIK